ncbi:hypothetical protein QBC32DRAFT_74887 [Pseudoneurospora amorphoporcata]|uniref:Glycosyl transferase family 25 domain-containing protein n=1 Tax=Pseudoneurospora amorphoporcata TaxID=241081 RepID=A0AAN6NZG1_9PEZI|nr:hypothetical protein QBC32DRAFT_74887 [Pseudoneurospora amorphoporcata]
MLLGEQTGSLTGNSSSSFISATITHWRSYRHIHRIALVIFVLLTIFVLERYRSALASTFVSTNSETKADPIVVPGGNSSPQGQHYESYPEAGEEPKQLTEEQLLELSQKNAGNSTLGFYAIKYINMKARYDREDAMALQAYISGLEIEDYPAVETDMIDPVGMPPTHRPGTLKTGEKGCWRAHANIWSEMTRLRSPPVLILESDAAWDINIRPIMSRLNTHFIRFLNQINSTAVHDPSYNSPNNHKLHGKPTYDPDQGGIKPNPDDPWLSEHWDLFSIGQCFEYTQDHEIKLVYEDESVPEGMDYWGETMGKQRVIRKSGGMTCTTAYAISHTGAAKLLLRSALDLDNPIDLLIRRLVMSRDLVAYSLFPPVMAQWGYIDGIGMTERGAQSDINGGKHQDTPADADMPGWKNVRETASIWTIKEFQRDAGFMNVALKEAWTQIIGEEPKKLEESLWNPETNN